MKNVWEKYLRGILFLYFEIYTAATLLNSAIYLSKGVFEDTYCLRQIIYRLLPKTVL